MKVVKLFLIKCSAEKALQNRVCQYIFAYLSFFLLAIQRNIPSTDNCSRQCFQDFSTQEHLRGFYEVLEKQDRQAKTIISEKL
jgi:hypothetical protein